jgi:hypothetical protein
MSRSIVFLSLMSMLFLSSCGKKETAEAPKAGAEAPAAVQAVGGPHAFIHLKDGSRVPGAIVASSQTDMVVAGDDGIERKIPIAQIASVEYADAQPERPPRQDSGSSVPPKQQAAQVREQRPAAAPSLPSAVTTRTYELPVGSEVSVRMDEPIDSGTAGEGQTFEARITRDAKDADGDVVIPRGSKAYVVIKSASKGGRFRGASDLVLDLQSVTIDRKQYTIGTAEISQKGKSGVGANKRTATYAGGGAALGAIIGAIAGGGKGAAIGAGSGAGAGVLTQVLTKGGAIKVPVESVLTFELDKPLRVKAVQ